MQNIKYARPHPTRRNSSDNCWPLRRADGKTWAQAKDALDMERTQWKLFP